MLSRREFIKLSSLLALAYYTPPKLNGILPNNENVLFIVFDTLSAKHISLSGYQRDTMPNLARFAEISNVYMNHYAGGNFTSPGTATLLTGTHPWHHRAFRLNSSITTEYKTRNIFTLFENHHRIAYTHNPLVNTLLQDFHNGIDTHFPMEELLLKESWPIKLFEGDIFTQTHSQKAVFNEKGELSSSLLLQLPYKKLRDAIWEKLIKQYGEEFPFGPPTISGGDLFFLLEDAVSWLEKHLGEFPSPYLGYFHFYPPHNPYTPRIDSFGRFQNDGYKPIEKERHIFDEGKNFGENVYYRRLYDEYIQYVDAEFGKLLDHLEKSGLVDNTWIIFTSDHGELFERGIRYHNTPVLFQPLIRIPLLIHEPGQKSTKAIETTTSAVDLVPTLLHELGYDIPEWVEGKILPPYKEGDENRSIFVLEAKTNPKNKPISTATTVIVKNNFKMIQYQNYEELAESPYYELYDLQNDPEELVNLFTKDNSIAKALADELQNKLDEVNRPFQ
jgi:arylsulfatase A-like enzyme